MLTAPNFIQHTSLSRTVASKSDFSSWVEVRLDLLRGNLRAVRRQLSKNRAEVLAVVKADAYGHGMKRVAQTLSLEGVNFFGVANIDEAIELRNVCPKARILVLGSYRASQIPLYREFEIIPTVSCVDDVWVLEKGLRGFGRPFPIHVKIDTGMGRLGIWHEDAEKLFRVLSKKKNLLVEGVYTHFSRADHRNKNFTLQQLKKFDQTVQKIRAMGIRPRYLHAANSLGLLRFKSAHFNLVRPGIVLYGLNPDTAKALPKGIKPILSWRAKIAFLKHIRQGGAVSYGATYRAKNSTWIATLPVGYSHGYRVALSGRAHVAAKGRRYPIAGRVTMDQTMVDLGRSCKLKRWDIVTLLGHDRTSSVSAEELASLLKTIPYEVVCSIHSRVPRLYIGR